MKPAVEENWGTDAHKAARGQTELAKAVTLAPLLSWDTVAAVAYVFAWRANDWFAAVCVTDYEANILQEASAVLTPVCLATPKRLIHWLDCPEPGLGSKSIAACARLDILDEAPRDRVRLLLAVY